jgi:hypothetical protein
VLLPRESTGCAETGSPEFPVVLLEVVVITPHQRHKLGPAQLARHLRVFVEEVHWISLEALSQQPNLDPLLNLLSLPVRPENELAATSQQILAMPPDLHTVVLPILVQRFS